MLFPPPHLGLPLLGDCVVDLADGVVLLQLLGPLLRRHAGGGVQERLEEARVQLDLVAVVGDGVDQGDGPAGVGDGLLHVEEVVGGGGGLVLLLQLLGEGAVLKGHEINKGFLSF